MKILQIIDSLPTGGGARFVVNLTKNLLQKNIEVDVLLLDGSATPFYAELASSNCRIHSLTTGNRWNPINVFRIIPYLKKYDLVHVHIFPTSYYVALANQLSYSDTPILFTEHNSQNRRASHFIFKYLERWMYSRYDRIVCLTNDVKNFVVENLNVKESKLDIIENGLDYTVLHKSIPYSKIDLGFQVSDQIITMAARLTSQKDHKTLIEALIMLPSHFHILLLGEGALKSELQNFAISLNVQTRVHFLGNRSDVYRILKTSDYIVMSSHFEGLSLSALEGLASGKPFIASNVSGLNFIEDAGLLFERRNHIELASIILELENNPQYYETVVLKCQERAKMYDIEEMTSKYLDLYTNLIKSE